MMLNYVTCKSPEIILLKLTLILLYLGHESIEDEKPLACLRNVIICQISGHSQVNYPPLDRRSNNAGLIYPLLRRSGNIFYMLRGISRLTTRPRFNLISLGPHLGFLTSPAQSFSSS